MSKVDEKAATVTGFVERALASFAEHGITCKRLMTDNAFIREPITAEDVADCALFLGSRYARKITGQVLRVDGGQLIG